MNNRRGNAIIKTRSKTSTATRSITDDAESNGSYILGLQAARVMVLIINLLDQGLQALASGRLRKQYSKVLCQRCSIRPANRVR
jgi:hypothetical protein